MAWQKVKSTLPAGSYYFSGDEAVAEGAIAARCGYCAGYPITPATETLERLSVRFGEVGAVFMQMEDEIASICSCIGASWAGAKAMTITSGPGFSLMQEGIGYAAFTETPVVIVDAQRAGPSTGQATRVGSGDIMQAKWGSHGDYQTIALSPWSVQELYDQTINAFNLAEKYRVPVLLMAEEATAHLRERIQVGEEVALYNREKKPGAPPFGTEEDDGVPPMPTFGDRERLLVTGSTHDEWGIRKITHPDVHERLVRRLHNKILHHRQEIIQYETYYLEDASVVVVCYGFTARSALFAVERLREEGKKIGMVRLKTLWPFAQEVVKDIGSKVKKILVPEMNMGQVAGEVMKYAACEVVPYSQVNGEIIHPHTIMEQLRRLS
ncbi:MAG TPA: 2-oxoacid:acceptor oxidoreductase subunit alpha [Dehalococcoidia bacterium]|jgi:2-oxoglutarate ferredoxin oxidoreductase subunit alpha|nr:2-oxoacid:acceptor oxidoreductase subunit alpha [Dehalococcoidia bacterium]